MTGRICACGCGTSLDGLRADAVYASEACSKCARRADSPDKGRTEHPLADARASQEASELNRQLGQLVRQAIIHQLETAGRVHADDLEPHFPAEHVKRCRKLTGAQFGQLASRRYVLGVEYRKSTVPERKGAKSWVYVFTDLGRQKLAGVGAVKSASSARDVEPGLQTVDGADPGEPEPLSLLPDGAGRARPRSAFTTPEAA